MADYSHLSYGETFIWRENQQSDKTIARTDKSTLKKKEGWSSVSKSQDLFYNFSTELKDKYDPVAELQTLGVGQGDL